MPHVLVDFMSIESRKESLLEAAAISVISTTIRNEIIQETNPSRHHYSSFKGFPGTTSTSYITTTESTRCRRVVTSLTPHVKKVSAREGSATVQKWQDLRRPILCIASGCKGPAHLRSLERRISHFRIS